VKSFLSYKPFKNFGLRVGNWNDLIIHFSDTGGGVIWRPNLKLARRGILITRKCGKLSKRLI
jgi:hypothetical protein